jgi:hypothetical protein
MGSTSGQHAGMQGGTAHTEKELGGGQYVGIGGGFAHMNGGHPRTAHGTFLTGFAATQGTHAFVHGCTKQTFSGTHFLGIGSIGGHLTLFRNGPQRAHGLMMLVILGTQGSLHGSTLVHGQVQHLALGFAGGGQSQWVGLGSQQPVIVTVYIYTYLYNKYLDKKITRAGGYSVTYCDHSKRSTAAIVTQSILS